MEKREFTPTGAEASLKQRRQTDRLLFPALQQKQNVGDVFRLGR